MTRVHRYIATVRWTGNLGTGTTTYGAYSRNHDIAIAGKPVLHASSDAMFRGDPSRYTPEDMLVSSLSSCHMLWYLHLCADNKIVVTDYVDHALGIMEENADGSGQFSKVTLQPRVTVATQGMIERAISLHTQAHKLCFIARSVNFPVEHAAETVCLEDE